MECQLLARKLPLMQRSMRQLSVNGYSSVSLFFLNLQIFTRPRNLWVYFRRSLLKCGRRWSLIRWHSNRLAWLGGSDSFLKLITQKWVGCYLVLFVFYHWRTFVSIKMSDIRPAIASCDSNFIRPTTCFL